MKQSQGDKVIAALKRRPHTYMEMLALGVSICPHKRAVERIAAHPGWRIQRAKRHMGGREYLTTWRVVRA